MDKKIKVLGTEIDCLSSKEAMKFVIRCFDGEPMDAGEIISMAALLGGQGDRRWEKWLGSLQLILAGEKEILEAAGVDDRRLLREAEERTFLRMFIKYLHKNRRRVYLLAETEEDLQRVEEKLRQYGKGIRITGKDLLDPRGNTEERVINDINGTETDCILSVLPSPYQERFVSRCRAYLNVKLWMGCGNILWAEHREGKFFDRIRRFFLKKVFWHQVGQGQDGD